MKYEVKSPLKDDAGLHEIGDSIDMDVKEAQELVDIGVLEAVASPAPSDPEDPERLSEITTAIEKLDPANADLWLRDGKPSTEAIAAVIGSPVSAAERDAAWTSIQKAQG